jgi:hypothetical protein
MTQIIRNPVFTAAPTKLFRLQPRRVRGGGARTFGPRCVPTPGIPPRATPAMMRTDQSGGIVPMSGPARRPFRRAARAGLAVREGRVRVSGWRPPTAPVRGPNPRATRPSRGFGAEGPVDSGRRRALPNRARMSAEAAIASSASSDRKAFPSLSCSRPEATPLESGFHDSHAPERRAVQKKNRGPAARRGLRRDRRSFGHFGRPRNQGERPVRDRGDPEDCRARAGARVGTAAARLELRLSPEIGPGAARTGIQEEESRQQEQRKSAETLRNRSLYPAASPSSLHCLEAIPFPDYFQMQMHQNRFWIFDPRFWIPDSVSAPEELKRRREGEDRRPRRKRPGAVLSSCARG